MKRIICIIGIIIVLFGINAVMKNNAHSETDKITEIEEISDNNLNDHDAIYTFPKNQYKYYQINAYELNEGKWTKYTSVSGALNDHNVLRIINGYLTEDNSYDGRENELGDLLIKFEINSETGNLDVPVSVKNEILKTRRLFSDDICPDDREKVIGYVISYKQGLEVINKFSVDYFEKPSLFNDKGNAQYIAVTLKLSD